MIMLTCSSDLSEHTLLQIKKIFKINEKQIYFLAKKWEIQVILFMIYIYETNEVPISSHKWVTSMTLEQIYSFFGEDFYALSWYNITMGLSAFEKNWYKIYTTLMRTKSL